MTWTPLIRCLACATAEVVPFLALGPQPLANAFLEPGQESLPEPFFPMNVARCPACGHVQLAELVDRSLLFSHYLYVSGTSETIPAHFRDLARTVCERVQLAPGDRVVEAGSNDGTLLAAFLERGARVTGVEPAANIARLAADRGVPTIVRFFDAGAAADIAADGGPARVIVGTNVFAHLADPCEFLAGARRLLAADGLLVLEVPYLLPMLDRVEFDTIYHEHVSYYALGPLVRLFDRSGLALVDAELVDVHGGSVRLFARHSGGPDRGLSALLAAERLRDLTGGEPQRMFARRVAELPGRLGEALDRLRRTGGSVAGYGAAAKGTTLLNYCRITRWMLPWIADRAPLKHGRLVPGVHVPVVPVSRIEEERPDVLLVLAWNFAGEIIRQQAAHAARGGRFLIPLPEPALS
jgi:novobiocin biosynthesis protein NovU/D-mycarose 3-C-methyltransferase